MTQAALGVWFALGVGIALAGTLISLALIVDNALVVRVMMDPASSHLGAAERIEHELRVMRANFDGRPPPPLPRREGTLRTKAGRCR